MTTQVHADGLAALGGALRAAGAQLADMPDAGLAAATVIATAARSTAPRRTGALSLSLEASFVQGIAEVTSPLAYAATVHFGSHVRRIRANPFVTIAADRTREQWVNAYADGAQDVLARAAQLVNDQ